ncbi:hypothetical protein NQZ68_002728 [Dissostichus eleginoides]|nr:hypothetical protein NQZ68_002728 [Dissostichus eleginoides]
MALALYNVHLQLKPGILHFRVASKESGETESSPALYHASGFLGCEEFQRKTYSSESHTGAGLLERNSNGASQRTEEARTVMGGAPLLSDRVSQNTLMDVERKWRSSTVLYHCSFTLAPCDFPLQASHGQLFPEGEEGKEIRVKDIIVSEGLTCREKPRVIKRQLYGGRINPVSGLKGECELTDGTD